VTGSSNLYTYNGAITPAGTARAEPIIQQFLAIESAFKKLDAEDLQRLMDMLRDIFPSLADGGAIFTKYWPVVTAPAIYTLDMGLYGTHIIPLGANGDCTINYTNWPAKGTKFAMVIIINGGLGIVRWPVSTLWQTRGNVPPILKENGFDTIALWRDSDVMSFQGNNVVLAARAGR
jgi:hypothetical protein